MYKKAVKFYNRFKAQTGKEPSNIAKPPSVKRDQHKDIVQIRNGSSPVAVQAANEKENLIGDLKKKSENAQAKMRLFSERFKAKRAKAYTEGCGKKNINETDQPKGSNNAARRRAQLNKVVFRRKHWTVH
jgi:hypothetical protein